MPRFNLGLFQKKFNSTSRVTGPAINMGSTRGRGSTTRMFNYCTQHSSNPSSCINQFITMNNGGGSSTIQATVPTAPEITSITPGNAQFTIYFNAPSSDGGSPITSYKVTYDGGDSNYDLYTTTSPATTVDILSNGLLYNVQIRAVNAKGIGALSNVVQSTPYTIPGVPQIQSLTPGSNSITVTFSEPTTDGGSTITNYQYSLNNIDYINFGSMPGIYTISGLNNGQTYYFRMRAVNAAGPGNASNSQPVTPN